MADRDILPHRPSIWIPGADAPPQQYMPHLKHIDDYLKASGLDAAGQTGVAMIAAVAAVQRYAASANIAQKQSRMEVVIAASSDFYQKLRRYIA